MQKKGELSRLTINLLIGSLIIILAIIIWILLREGFGERQELYDDSSLNLKISEVKKIDDSTLNVTVKRNSGEGEFVALSFLVDDGTTTEIIRKNISIEEYEEDVFSLNFILINASKIKRVSITPIFINEEGKEVIGNVKDEYITPNTCSNYCPTGAQCGVNACGASCGNGCSSGYLCLNYKCIKEQSSSGGGGSGGSSSEEEINSEELLAKYANVYLDKGLRYGDALDYQCGTRNIDGTNFDYPGCLTGYDCVDNLCIARDDLSCDGVECASGEYCSHGVCLLDVPGETYFVALWGNDSWNGTFEQPFYTWQRVVGELGPGDIAYFRGGVWMPTQETWSEDHRSLGMLISGPSAYNTAVSGTPENPIRYFNYPGEKPIVDGELITINPGAWLYGISIEQSSYIHLKGLTVRHIHMVPPDFSGEYSREYSEVYGIGSVGSNIYYENIVVHDADGRGFQHWSSGIEEPGEPEHATIDNTTWINCDSYNLFDRYDNTPGNAADGWLVHGGVDNYYYFEGCRAFNFSDDGINGDGQSYYLIKDTWSMSSDKYEGLSDLWGIEGNGYKMSGKSPSMHTDYVLGEGGKNYVRIENSIAANCVGAGFINNIMVYMSPGEWPNNGLIYNNFGYKSSGNFWDGGANYNGTRSTVFRNNIAYKSTYYNENGVLTYEVGIYRPSIYPHSNNTWIGTMKADWEEGTWPGWEYNPAYNVTDEDFVSLDYSQLTLPRKADGSLPDITFGHLVQGSDLIDGGMIIPGYHCLTSGAHPGENCREWFGNAPDLGPFESNY